MKFRADSDSEIDSPPRPNPGILIVLICSDHPVNIPQNICAQQVPQVLWCFALSPIGPRDPEEQKNRAKNGQTIKQIKIPGLGRGGLSISESESARNFMDKWVYEKFPPFFFSRKK